MTSILRYVAEAFPPAMQGTLLNNHRVIGIAANTSMLLNCALVTYIMMTADAARTIMIYCLCLCYDARTNEKDGWMDCNEKHYMGC